jgi:hypothetical protein
MAETLIERSKGDRRHVQPEKSAPIIACVTERRSCAVIAPDHG